MKKVFCVVLFIVSMIIPSIVFAHSGGTDSYGGHHNRKTGGYHYHHKPVYNWDY